MSVSRFIIRWPYRGTVFYIYNIARRAVLKITAKRQAVSEKRTGSYFIFLVTIYSFIQVCIEIME